MGQERAKSRSRDHRARQGKKLSRVAKTHPGEDGTVRTVTVKTTAGNVKRAAKLVCPLSIEQQ